MSRVAVAESAKRQPLLTTTAASQKSQRGSAKIGRRGSRMGETAGECGVLLLPLRNGAPPDPRRVPPPEGLWRKMLLRKKRQNSPEEAAEIGFPLRRRGGEWGGGSGVKTTSLIRRIGGDRISHGATFVTVNLPGQPFSAEAETKTPASEALKAPIAMASR